MKNIKFKKTDDGTTGLYNEEISDIYHAKEGAYKEAVEKFIKPSGINEKQNKDIKILDICYGIGYNTKAALENYTNNYEIDCIENNKELILLSPFVEDGVKDIEIKIFILSELIQNGNSLEEIYTNLKENYTGNESFYSSDMISFIEFLIKGGYKSKGRDFNLSFLHNIYYNYISHSEIYDKKPNKYANSILNFKIDDARKILSTINKKYDYVFLDAFSAQKDPTLWTLDFLYLIKLHMNNNSIFVTYSKSTPLRSSLINLGFKIKKIYINDFDMATSASMNNNFETNIDDYDLKLYKTRSSIPYRDFNLNSSPDKIISLRTEEQNNSCLISQTSLKKYYSYKSKR